jgi:hypothetical protein
MIRMSSGPDGAGIQAVVIVAFDRVTGQVHATFAHGSHGSADAYALERDRDRLLAELADRIGADAAALETIELSLDELSASWIEQIDTRTRKPRTQALKTKHISCP